jgi:hypothetical protein
MKPRIRRTATQTEVECELEDGSFYTMLLPQEFTVFLAKTAVGYIRRDKDGWYLMDTHYKVLHREARLKDIRAWTEANLIERLKND